MVMQPFDTALTRVYNQPTERIPNGRGGFKTVGLLYRNPIDCLWKTISTEGVTGLYKGVYRRYVFIDIHSFHRINGTLFAYRTAHHCHINSKRKQPQTSLKHLLSLLQELIIGVYRRFRDKKPE